MPVAQPDVTVTLTEMTSTGQTVTIATTTTNASGKESRIIYLYVSDLGLMV